MKSIFSAALLLGLSAFGFAQNKISGVVTDVNKAPLVGVSIYMPDLQKGTVTKSDGSYNIANLPSGNIRVLFSYVGYNSQNVALAILQNDTKFDVVLEESVHQMDEVIVSTAFNRLQSQNVMKVEHATMESLQRSGAATLSEGLATIPGVSQISTGTSIGKPVIRGLSGNRVLVYSQGVRIENQQFGDEHGLGLNDSGIESVEVIKGPASLLYGSDALGGVLYFNPEKFADANTWKGDFRQRFFSNTLGSNTSIGVKTSTDNWRFLARGNYATHSDYEIPNGQRVTNSRFNEQDLKFAVGHSSAKFSSVLRYNYNKLDLGLPEEIGIQSKNKEPLSPKQDVESHIMSLHNRLFFGKSSLEADFGYISNIRQEFEETVSPILDMNLQTLNYNLKYHFPKGLKFEAIGGIQGLYQTNDNSGEEFLIPDAMTTDFGVFTTINYEWSKNVLQAGVRFDNRHIKSYKNGVVGEEGYFAPINNSYQSFNASAGLKTELFPALTLRINLASGYRAPNLAELTSNGVHEGTNRYEIGNSQLGIERNFQTDVNFEYKSGHFELFVNGFYNYISDYIYVTPTGQTIDENNVFEYVQDDARLYGGEAGIHLHPHPFDWLHFESSFETVTATRADGSFLPLIPANNWNNTIRTQFSAKSWLKNGYANVGISSTFSQKNVGLFETGSAGYTLVNLGAGGDITIHKMKFSLQLGANNLLDKTYIAHLSRLKADGIPDMGRNIFLSVNFNL
ncbi:MAG TPA: TonB-dependent receptor [Flavobacterium sp.]|jgi:iron complex outermembrane receptor protein